MNTVEDATVGAIGMFLEVIGSESSTDVDLSVTNGVDADTKDGEVSSCAERLKHHRYIPGKGWEPAPVMEHGVVDIKVEVCTSA